jgi:Crinkler effector protein N-terminal domain
MVSREDVWCILGDDPKRVYQINVNMAKTVAHLKKTIAAEVNSDLRGVSHHDLSLWKASVAKERLYVLGGNDLNTLTDLDELHSMDVLSGAFSDPVVEGHVRILIVRHHGE